LKDLPEILEKCKRNERAAQADLYTWLAPKLLGLCLRYLPDRDEAEDVMQDAFVKVFMNLDSYKGEGSFEGWAKRIAVNTALTALKKKNRIRFERDLTVINNADITEEEEQLVNTKQLMSCMGSLPDGYRTIINLFLVEEFSHKEIGEKLGISESTSRSQFSRARQALVKLVKAQTADKLPNGNKYA
jgi:RNA polymerase sigma-70 factor (ECF subfamily)